jgi:hypothetical protein
VARFKKIFFSVILEAFSVYVIKLTVVIRLVNSFVLVYLGCSSSKTNPVYGRRVNSFVLVLVFHHTDTSLYLLSLALALSIHNKLDFLFVVFHHTDTHIYLLSLALALSIHNTQFVYLLVSHRTDSFISLVYRSRFLHL